MLRSINSSDGKTHAPLRHTIVANPKRRHMSKKPITEQDLIDALARANRTDNPNPRRNGCPPEKVLEQLARFPANDIPIEHSTLLHLSDCWPCGEELKRLRAK
jgi:hypothetical protein